MKRFKLARAVHGCFWLAVALLLAAHCPKTKPLHAAQNNRVVRVVTASATPGSTINVSVELTAQGNENSLGFSLEFNSATLTNPQATLGSGATGAALNVNANQAAQGRLGLALALSAGQSFAAGTRQMVVVAFRVAENASTGTIPIGFSDLPVAREVADVQARALETTFAPGALVIIIKVASVSAASFGGTELASESIVAAFGFGLAPTTQTAFSLPLPTTLAGTRVTVRDSAGVTRDAPLFFVSPGQVNYLLPPGTTNGAATITIISNNLVIGIGTVPIASVAPGLFAANANGQGVPAAVALRVRGDSSQSYEPVAQFDATAGRFVPTPIDLGASTEQILLILFGTGIRGRSALTAVTCRIGGVETPVGFAGAQGDFVGLDQINVGPLPRSLAGRGELDLVLTVDGKTANTVRVNVK